jgi:hypothetical protein
MKKVKVFTLTIDALLDGYNKFFQKRIIDTWMSSEEYKFIERNSISIEQVKIKDHDRLGVIISYYAVMDEQIETFWRLKFK